MKSQNIRIVFSFEIFGYTAAYSMPLDLNPTFQKALSLLMESSSHVFITGKAGTGKSTFLEYFRAQSQKKVVVLAPTGVAALNVR